MNKPETVVRVDVEAVARELREARANRRAVEPVGTRYGIPDMDTAYAIQDANTRYYIDHGRRLTGCKIGLTSEAVQKQLGVDQPDFGMLYADMEVVDGGVADIHKLIAPKIEAEVAFVMGKDATAAEMTPAEFASCIAYCLPALEIVDSAIADWRITLVDTIADNASSGMYVLGATPVRLTDVDLRLAGMVMERDGVNVSLGVGAACLGNPLNAGVWLARTMARFGRPLKAGDVVMSGALGPMVAVTPGTTWTAHVAGLGTVRCRFSA